MKFKALFAIASISLLGCKPNVAVKYNDMIVEYQNKLKAGMSEAEPKLKNYFATFEYDSIVSVSSKIETKIDSIIQKLQKEPSPKAEQGDDFKKAALNYFDYFKTIYSTYKNYGLQTTPEDRLNAGQDMALILSHENKMIADMLRAQIIFAKNNKFKIRRASQNNSLVKK